jgi:hypothetical protein
MSKYLDLSSVIDVEPEVSHVLNLVDDADLQDEFWQRLDVEFFKEFVEDYCRPDEVEMMKRIIDNKYLGISED